jgi:hypothetical protein
MVVFSYVVGVLVLLPILLRQIMVAPVPRSYTPRLAVVLGVVGLFAMSSYASDHHVTAHAWAWVAASLVLGAVGLGALRAVSMRVWKTNGWVVRRANAVTMSLWLAWLVASFVGNAVAGLVGASFLLYLGLTWAVQQYVVYRRAQPMWDQLGPDAGRPFIMNLTQGPGAFFATFRTGAPGAGGPTGWGTSPEHDPNVIDVEVVDDDDDHGPPELHAPR